MSVCAVLTASDHPRIRGEHDSKERPSSMISGSSPHTRGALHQHARRLRQSRIIPAYAGSTSVVSGPFQEVRDHPRIRGEHSVDLFVAECGGGSSPHTRGAPGPVAAMAPPGRIIPAYAGSTSWRLTDAMVEGDHPRIRGEHEA